MMESKGTTIAAYIRNSPKEVQKSLKQMYQIIKAAAPTATETIS